MLQLLANCADEANAVNLSTACVRLAKCAARSGAALSRSDRELFGPHLRRLEASAVRLLRDADPRGVAGLLWGFAKLGYFPEKLLSELERALGGEGLEGSEAAQKRQSFLWRRDGEGGRRPLEAWEPQGLAMAVYALGLLGIPVRSFPNLLAALEAESAAQLSELTPQGVSLTVWAFCKLEHPGALRLLVRVEEVFRRAPEDGSGGRKGGEVEDNVLSPPPSFEGWPSQALGSLAFGMGSVEGDLSESQKLALLTAVDAELARTLGSLAGREDATALANSLWGFGRCGFRPEAFLTAAAAMGEAELAELFEGLTPSNVSYAALGLAWLGESWPTSALARALCGRAVRIAQDFAGVDSLVPALWSFVALGVHLNPGEGRYSAEERALAGWWNSITKSSPGALAREDLRRLAEAKTLLTAEASDAVYDDMRPERGDFAGAIATAGVGGDGIDSVGADADPRQASLAAALARVLETGGADKVSIFSDHASGAPTALRAPGDLDVALFVDGPELFALGGNSSVPLGRLGLRDRLLHAAGYDVASVPWSEWETLPEPDGQDEFLRDLLREIRPGLLP